MSASRLRPFCLTDPVFFDTPERSPDTADRPPIAFRRVPPGWDLHESGWWISLRPPGVELPTQGWQIHVAMTVGDAARVCAMVWRYCLDHGLAATFPRSETAVWFANSTFASRAASAKALTVYPVDETQFGRVLPRLSALLAGVRGPGIPGDLRYGDGPLHVRYGAFPDGAPDLPGLSFRVPASVPVPAVLRAHLRAYENGATGELPYHFERVLRSDNGGGVYVARHEQTGERVVVRQARPYAGLDRDGTDAPGRLQRGRAVRERLAGLDCVPHLIEYRVAWEHHFLVEEYVEGSSVHDTMMTRQPFLEPEPAARTVAEYTAWVLAVLARLDRAITEIHARGIPLDDLSLDSVLVGPDGRVVLLGSAFVSHLDDECRRADRHLLSRLTVSMFLPVTARTDPDPRQLAAVHESYPVPAGVDANLVRGSHPDTEAPGNPTVDLLRADPPDWPAIRDSLVAGIHASATPDRDDRLFPGDPAQFSDGGHTFAFGAAGVMHALHTVGAPVPEEYVAWLIRTVRRAPNPHPGLPEVATVLYRQGRVDEALELIHRASAVEPPADDAGTALALLHFARLTGTESLRSAAIRNAEAMPLPPAPDAGPLSGHTGAALLFLHLYEDSADIRYLNRAHAALISGWAGPSEPVLSGGGSLALVLQRYLRHRDDREFEAALTVLRRRCRRTFVREAGLYRGRAGLIATLSTLGAPEDRPAIATHLRQLAWLAETYAGHLAFPGAESMRLSMDVATGSAGVLLALSTAFDATPILPQLSPGIGLEQL